jgi:DNA-binding transcriptional LysR family regulator
MKNVHPYLDARSINIFIEAAKEHSFKAAARHLGITPSAVSKAIARLESELGVVLLIRNSRTVTLTEEGQLFYDYGREVVSAMENARNAVVKSSRVIEGLLRVSVPVDLGETIITPHIPAFLKQYPAIQMQLILTNRRMSFGDDHIDVALWHGHLPDSRLVAKALGRLKLATCASNDYLQSHGSPTQPSDLVDHHCLGIASETTGLVRPWQFNKAGRSIEHMPSGRMISNNQRSLVKMAEAGLGIIQVPEYLAADAIKQTALIPLFEDFKSEGAPLSIIFQRASTTPKIRSFIDFIAAIFDS